MGEIVGREVSFVETEQTVSSVVIDTTKMHELVGRTEVDGATGCARWWLHSALRSPARPGTFRPL